MPAPTHPPDHRGLVRLLLEARDCLVSLKLTLVLLVLSMLLVFVATLDQVNLGIWAVQEKYFRSFIVYTQFRGVSLPLFPGGYTVGGLLLANLIAGHVYRFGFAWRKAGIVLTHFGLIVLLVGELLTGLWQEDFHMRINEGETRNYAESFRETELVLIDATDAGFDEVVAIPEKLLARKTPLQHPKLPFRVAAKTYYPNSTIQTRNTATGQTPAAVGLGDHLTAAPLPITYKSDERNIPSAFVELSSAEGPLGTYLVSPHLAAPQQFTHNGRTWKIAFRVKRSYQPFALTLLKFSHDRYAGTEIPKNFSSRLRLTTPNGQDDREVLIYMNNPLRYAGLTFYQSGYDGDRTTILQVVHNPSWLFPYVACSLMTLGLTLQFAIHLVAFIRQRRRATTPAAASAATRATTRPRSAAQTA